MQQCSCLPFRLSAVAGLVSFLHLRISTRKFSKSSHHQLSIGAWMYNDENEEPNTSSTEPRVPGSKRLFQGPAAHRMWMFFFARLAIHWTIRQSWRSISLFSVRLCEWAPNRMGNWATDDRLEKTDENQCCQAKCPWETEVGLDVALARELRCADQTGHGCRVTQLGDILLTASLLHRGALKEKGWKRERSRRFHKPVVQKLILSVGCYISHHIMYDRSVDMF